MKHLRKFNEEIGITPLAAIFGSAAFLKIIYNMIKRKYVLKGISKKDLSILDYITNQFTHSREIIGKIIDNDRESQVVYEYGGGDNLITLSLDKVNRTFEFRWNFSQPIFPYLKFSNNDQIEIENLSDEEMSTISNIFAKIKRDNLR